MASTVYMDIAKGSLARRRVEGASPAGGALDLKRLFFQAPRFRPLAAAGRGVLRCAPAGAGSFAGLAGRLTNR